MGITLLPELAVRPPVPPSDDIVLLRFAEPVPRRQIAMFWRRTSVYRDLLPSLAEVVRAAALPLVGQGADGLIRYCLVSRICISTVPLSDTDSTIGALGTDTP